MPDASWLQTESGTKKHASFQALGLDIPAGVLAATATAGPVGFQGAGTFVGARDISQGLDYLVRFPDLPSEAPEWSNALRPASSVLTWSVLIGSALVCAGGLSGVLPELSEARSSLYFMAGAAFGGSLATVLGRRGTEEVSPSICRELDAIVRRELSALG